MPLPEHGAVVNSYELEIDQDPDKLLRVYFPAPERSGFSSVLVTSVPMFLIIRDDIKWIPTKISTTLKTNMPRRQDFNCALYQSGCLPF